MAWIIPLAGILGATGVAIGAVGTHALHLGARAMMQFDIALDYQIWHTLALLAVAQLIRFDPAIRAYKIAAILFAIGVVCFSGSLYGVAISGIQGITNFTPIGGSMLILGWILLVIGGVQTALSFPKRR